MKRNARVYIKFQELMAEAEQVKPFTELAEQRKIPKSLEFPEPRDSRARFFDFQVVGILEGHVKESLPADQFNVLVFLCGLKVVPTCSIGNGISWLELYGLYLVQSGQTEAPTTAKAGMSPKKRLRDFTSQVRSVVSSFFAEEENVHFKPSIKRVSRLQELGSRTTCQPCVSSPWLREPRGKRWRKHSSLLLANSLSSIACSTLEGCFPLSCGALNSGPFRSGINGWSVRGPTSIMARCT